MTVVEDIMLIGAAQPLRSIVRDEHQLLSPPHAPDLPIKLWRDYPPLTVVHFPQEYRAQPFAPPRGLYENDELRVEWQTMDNRQPFYHRNCDVDEISYQIAGDRTLMTELGVVEHVPGDFSLIPRGVAHDNYGRTESHLLFYFPAPVTELEPPHRVSAPADPPFPGWTAGNVNEAVTQCMGAPGHDITVFRADEQLLLNQVQHEARRIQIQRANPNQDTTWLYSTKNVRIGTVGTNPGDERRYRRTLDADEIQYQASGRRTVISQRGIVELGPGDFVRVPLGIAHTEVSTEPGRYLKLLSHQELPQIAETDRDAEACTPERLAALAGTVAAQ
ncbi:cupin domain-containing protein [Sciscionella marina]|uniref:cupin domain-containing protein n=1 Tax=Sciscionella marina TaxID=508770 RepID=UPI000378972C|nr:cupin domain-containing protein [Sciscionella marina]